MENHSSLIHAKSSQNFIGKHQPSQEIDQFYYF